MNQLFSDRPRTVAFYTLGCKVNSYDTEAIREQFEQEGFEPVDFEEPADVYVVNTCTVTSLGDRKSRQMLRRARRRNPDALIVATGCYAQTAPEKVSEIEEVDLVVGTGERSRIVPLVEERLLGQSTPKAVTPDLMHLPFEELEISKTDEHTRAYVKIQDGCTQYCSYCIVPYARGPVRSRRPEHALEEIGRLAEAGFREIVLTGIHAASYGRDFKPSRNTTELNEELISLIEEAAKIPGIERIRFSSLEPRLMTEAFLERLSQIPAVCPHFPLSLQSGANATLKRMNRHYTAEEYKEITDRIRRFYPDAAITTDVIVGFPGESEEDFEESLKFVQDVGFSRMHIFKYSPREGTPAADYDDQVPPEVKKIRSERMEEAEHAMRHAMMKAFDGKTDEVLIEQRCDDGAYTGYTRHYLPVHFIPKPGTHGYQNQILKVRLSYTGEDQLSAVMAE